VQPPVVKALHGQSEQYFARGVNKNRPSRLQFAQSALTLSVPLAKRAEVAGECAAFICRTFFYWARSWNTESPESFRRNQMDFWDRLADIIIDNPRTEFHRAA
jgi:hypothetical protein